MLANKIDVSRWWTGSRCGGIGRRARLKISLNINDLRGLTWTHKDLRKGGNSPIGLKWTRMASILDLRDTKRDTTGFRESVPVHSFSEHI